MSRMNQLHFGILSRLFFGRLCPALGEGSVMAAEAPDILRETLEPVAVFAELHPEVDIHADAQGGVESAAFVPEFATEEAARAIHLHGESVKRALPSPVPPAVDDLSLGINVHHVPGDPIQTSKLPNFHTSLHGAQRAMKQHIVGIEPKKPLALGLGEALVQCVALPAIRLDVSILDNDLEIISHPLRRERSQGFFHKGPFALYGNHATKEGSHRFISLRIRAKYQALKSAKRSPA